MTTAAQAEQRMQEISKKLDAYDFSGICVIVRYEDLSFAVYHNAFVVQEGDWCYIFKEHGLPEFIWTDGDSSATMYKPLDPSSYSINGIDVRRIANTYATQPKRSFAPVTVPHW